MLKKNILATTLLLMAMPLAASASSFEGPIIVKGKAFVYKNNDAKRFMVRGVALSGVAEEFQVGSKKDRTPDADDDLLSEKYFPYLERVILPKLKKLNVNAIRVYRVDPAENHDKSMELLEREGIYVIMEIMNEKTNVNRINPQYSSMLYKRITNVIDAFHKYDNVLGFSVGNELVFPGNIFANVPKKEDAAKIEEKNAQIEKSLIRDAQEYMKKKGYREIPVGVAMQDGPADSPQEIQHKMIPVATVAQYYACDTDGVSADFIGMNSYRYVPPRAGAPKNTNAYDNHVKDVQNMNLPIIFTESGGQTRDDNVPAVSRDWEIIDQEFKDPKLYNHLSGDFAFMFFETDEKYGLYVQQKDIDDSIHETRYMDGKVNGGADNLADVYGKLANVQVPMPVEVREPAACPANFNPGLVGERVKVTVVNYADVEGVVVVQGGEVIKNLSRAPQRGRPAGPVSMDVLEGVEILLQKKPNFDAVCSVPGKEIKAGITIMNDVPWGGSVKCNIR